MAYSGSDLSIEFKKFFRREKTRLTKYLKLVGCTNVRMDYGFYYLIGWFNSPSGQLYYFNSSDVRHFGYKQLMYRTAKDYKDYSGGSNQYVGLTPDELKGIHLI